MAASLVTAAALTGCILLEPDEQYGPHCAIAGRERACGTCVSERCTSALDACCRGSDCGGLIEDVERCAQRGDASCEAVRAARGAEGARGSLSACVATACAAVCQELVGVSETSCREETLSEGRACTCVKQDAANDVACDASLLVGTRCCAPTGWPGASLECTCAPVACLPIPDGCICVLSTNAAADPSSRCEGTHCCASDDICTCRARPCDKFERVVEACSLEAVGCGPGRKEVARCSLRSTR